MPDYGPLYQAAGNQFNIDPLLLQSMAVQESTQGKNLGPSTAGAQGFMQFLPETAAKYGVDTQDATSSVFGASKYLNDLMNQHGDSLPLALATYGGTTPDSQYVKDVTNRYNMLKAAWAKTGPGTSGTGPAVDSDPASPTYGQPTGKNFTPPPSTPAADTTAKGNAGQPAPSVPTTDNAPGVSIAAPPTFAPPQGGGPKGQPAKTTEKNDPLSQAKPHVNEDGTPIAGAQPAPSEANDPLSRAQPHVSESGEPIQPVDTGQYLTSATSPGAQSVGSSAEISEGREPGPAVQAAINVATDPAQRARIAASQLNIPLDRIVIGQGNRLAAVDDKGQRYYIEPPPVFADQSALTRDASGTWQSNPMFISPYSRATPLGPGATPTNIPLALGGAIPGTVQNYLTWAPAGLGPVLGPAGVGAASVATTAGRNLLANYLDPDKSQAVPPLTPQDVKQALINTATASGLRLGGALFAPGTSTTLKGIGSEVPLQYPLGEAGGARAPWENPLVRPTETPMPGGPAEPVPLPTTEVPSAEVAGVPQVKTDAQIAAEDRAIPTDAPTLRFPLITDAAIKQQAKDVLHWYAQNGNITPEPGVEGTLPQLTENRGIAALLRGLRDRAGPVANEIGQVEEAQAAANRATIANLRGDEDQLTSLRQARTQQTADLEAKAVANKSPTNPSDVQDAVVKQLNSRAAQDPQVADALRDVYERLYQHDPLTGNRILDEAGNPQLQTDPEQLMGLRQSIAREMTRGAQSNRPDMRLASGQLSPVLDQLDAAITRGMPNYPEFNAAYREASKPITAMEYLQGRNMVDTATQTPMLSAVQRTLDDIYKQRVLSHGWQPAQDLSQDQIDQLTALRDQLRREYNLRRGMSIGPATFEKFTTSQMTNALMSPLMRYGRGIAAAGLGAHEFGLGGYALGLGEAGIEALAARRQMAVQQKFYSELAKLLLNRNGEGVAALREAPGATAPNALTGP